MTYTVLARKYRPQTFDDLVGQEHVTRTLGNAIETGRVAHAFLFTGVRGVGKTTSARILAKALNCANGPTPKPCNECDQCREITAGTDMDVLEMDGASNNSVDDVRRLQESIPYRPSRDRFKIVIVDEVHMLSTGAFNAFLKTLEEPPAHVKFIFATTESHKVPVTIRSRCQRYDFRMIPQGIVAKRVREILAAESIQADNDAVAIVAREAAGSMRDALTVLDQIVAYAGNELRGDDVAKTLGLAHRRLVHDMLGHTLQGRAQDVLTSVDALSNQGIDLLHFAKQLAELARDLVVLAVTKDANASLVDLVDEERKAAQELAQSVDVLELQRSFSALSKLVDDVARASLPRTVFEMGLVRIATRPPLQSLGEIVARLQAIESGANPGQRANLRSSSPGTERAPRVAVAEAPALYSAEQPAPVATTRPTAVVPAASAPVSGRPTPATAPSAPAPVSAPAPKPPTQSGDLIATWREIVHEVKGRRPALAACLEHASPVSLSSAKIVIAFAKGSFFGEQASTTDSKNMLAEAAKEILGGVPQIAIELGAAPPPAAAASIATQDQQRETDRRANIRKEALEHPVVQEAAQVFGIDKARMTVNEDIDAPSRTR